MSNFYDPGDDEAAQWCARLAAPDCSARERQAFEQWRMASAANARAYLDAQRVLQGIDRLAGRDDRLHALAEQAFSQAHPAGCTATHSHKSKRRWMVPAALAASLLFAVVGIRFPQGIAGREILSSELTVAYTTPARERRVLSLPDGSKVHLDGDSEITVRLTRHERHIELIAGRAFFEVAHDKLRPFSVVAGNTTTTALGTQFQVLKRSEDVVVTLAEGSVAVEDVSRERRWRERLSPGEQLSVAADSTPSLKRTDAVAATSWTHGRLIFRGTPLAAAVDEINRYANRKVRFGDPSLADLAVSGSFIVSESDQIVTALAAVLPLRIVNAGEDEVILFRRYETQSD
jgi:transmembrane sensor